jgi:spermidine synthase
MVERPLDASPEGPSTEARGPLMTPTLLRWTLLAAFFVSGAAGLVYEVVWTRQLSLIFGVTTYAVATVLSTYMGGLALGSYVLGRWIDRRGNPLLAYAALEAGIGLYALVVPTLFVALRPAYIALRHLDLSYPVFAFVRAFLAALVLMPPTTLMGGTFPILTRFWVRARGEVGRGAGLLYFVNTAGAIAGCVVAGFVLIEWLGLRGTTRAAAAANLGVAAVAAVVSRRLAVGSVAADVAEGGEDGDGIAPRMTALILVCIGVSGFTSLAYEVLWTRALLRYLYNSTYAFTAMLATFLAGLALGSWLYTAILRRVRNGIPLLAALQTLSGLAFVGSSLIFPHVVSVAATLLGTDRISSFTYAVVAMFVRAALILLPPTIFLGAALPLATAICARGLASLGNTVGRIYAVNTLGAIFGSLGAGFLLIPAIGMQGTLTLLIALNLASGAALALAALSTRAQRFAAAAAFAVIITASLHAIPRDLFITTFTRNSNERLVFYREGATDTVGVIETAGQREIVYEDRRGTAGTMSHAINFFLGHLPLLLHPGEPHRILHICFGVGNSLSAVVAHDSVERVDSVELSPHVIEAAPYFWTNSDVISDPKVHTIIDDGRNFVMASRETYDVIMLEPPETFTAGVINLYTRDFYRDALARLAPDGVMMQWIRVGEGPVDQERQLFRAFFDVFPHATAWRQLDVQCILLIGSRNPLTIDYQRLQRMMQDPRIRRDLKLAGVVDADHLLSFFAFDEAAFSDFVRDVPAVEDDHTVLDFAMPRYIGSGFGLGGFNASVSKDGENPFTVSAERQRYYLAHSRSVVPYLTNLGNDTPEAIMARIAERGARTMIHPMIPQDKWRR